MVMILSLSTGCSWTLHKSNPDEKNPADTGTKTELKLKGPKAAIEYKF
ncbi:MAG: hypothetical protein ABH875_07475 [Candidatus Omnitrophota bacterium]